MSLQAKVSVLVSALLSAAADMGEVSQRIPNFGPSFDFANGSGANQANKLFSDNRTLAASTSENLDLAGGGLTDALGQALTFANVRAIVIRAAAGNTNNVNVGGAASNAFLGPFADATDIVKVKPGGVAVFVAPDATGFPVTAGTGDILKVANSGAGTGVTYDVIIIGS